MQSNPSWIYTVKYIILFLFRLLFAEITLYPLPSLICNTWSLGTWETEAGGLWLWSQRNLHSKTPCQSPKANKDTSHNSHFPIASTSPWTGCEHQQCGNMEACYTAPRSPSYLTPTVTCWHSNIPMELSYNKLFNLWV